MNYAGPCALCVPGSVLICDEAVTRGKQPAQEGELCRSLCEPHCTIGQRRRQRGCALICCIAEKPARLRDPTRLV